MTCTEFLDRYSEYDDSLIGPVEADRFREHMSECESCARYDRVLLKGRMIARQLAAPEPSDDFVPRLHLRLWHERGRLAHPATPVPRLAAALPAATLLLALAVAAVVGTAADAGPGLAPGIRSAHDGSAPAVALPAVQTAAPRPAAGQSVAPPRTAGRSVAAPTASELLHPAAWTVRRVDPEAAGSYSPLTMGPPAYGSANPRTSVSLTTYPLPY